jgi:hypothetical protein
MAGMKAPEFLQFVSRQVAHGMREPDEYSLHIEQAVRDNAAEIGREVGRRMARVLKAVAGEG